MISVKEVFVDSKSKFLLGIHMLELTSRKHPPFILYLCPKI